MKTDGVGGESTQEYAMPCAEAVVMATLALMTGHAQNDDEHQLAALAHKIRSNLEILATHRALSSGFKQAALSLITPWVQQENQNFKILTDHRQRALYLPMVHTIQ